MKRLALRTSKALAAVTLVTLLSACGGSGGSTPAVIAPPSGSNPPEIVPPTPTIEGIATPSSVSVVTATNAG